MLALLVPHLPDSLKDKTRDEAFETILAEWNWSQVEWLVDLAPCLPEDFLRRALAMVQKLWSDEHQTKAVIGLVPYLSETSLEQVLPLILKMESGRNRATMLKELASHSSKPLLQHVLSILQESNREEQEIVVYMGFMFAKFGRLQDVLAIVPKIEDRNERAEVLATLAYWLTEQDRIKDAFDITMKLAETYMYWGPLWKLAQYLPHTLLREALTVTQERLDGMSRVKTTRMLTTYLPESERSDILWKALNWAMAVSPEHIWEDEIETLVSNLAILPRSELVRLWSVKHDGHSPFQHLAQYTRKELLAIMPKLMPAIATLGGTETVIEVYSAIQDVGRWWP